MKNILIVIGLILSVISITLNISSIQENNFTWALHLSTAGLIVGIISVTTLISSKLYDRKE